MAITYAGFVALLLTGVGAGTLGALIGIGGGIVLVPILVAGFGFDIRIAVATSLVAVVATSTAATVSYVEDGLPNMRLGITLEIATTVGALTGGVVAILLAPGVIAGLFAVVMMVTALLVWRHVEEHETGPVTDAIEVDARESPGFAGEFSERGTGRLIAYQARRLGFGSLVSGMAGLLSGLLGVGGGFLKVPAMTLGMGVPTKVAAATSNFMIGVTAISGLLVYFANGYVRPMVAVPTALGIVAGALIGARMSARVSALAVRRVLAVVLVLVSVQMGLEAFGVELYG